MKLIALEFREHVEDQYPQLTEYYNTVSGLYLKVMPKRLRDQLLEIKEDDGQGQTSATPATAPSATNSTSPSAITAAAVAVATTITQTQSNSSPKK